MLTKKPWFKAKEYGWGWYPTTWQGWGATITYISVNIWNFWRIDQVTQGAGDALMRFIPVMFVSTAVLVAICAATGEEAGWRWGEDKDNNQKKP